MALRIIFMGTPKFSVPTLSALVDAGHKIVAVYCQPARPSGRGLAEKKSPVHHKADELDLPVFTPTSLKDASEQQLFKAHNADIAVVVAYGLILPQPILNAPRLGCINGHASLLPRWRGAAPIQRAIEAGDTQTGVMIMKMEAGLDTGPVMISEKVEITPGISAGQLHDVLSVLSADLMVEGLSKLETGSAQFTPQSSDGVTYASKLKKSQSHIEWNQPAGAVHNHIRAMSPFPGAWCEIKIGGRMIRVKILESELIDAEGHPGEVLDENLTIACATGAIRPIRLQKAGKQPGSLGEFLRGNHVETGQVVC